MTNAVEPKKRRNRAVTAPVERTGQRGRPEYSDAVREAILGFLRMGMTRYAAAGAAGIVPATFYDWIDKREGFREDVLEAEAYGAASYERDLSSLRRSNMPPSVRLRAVEFFLSRRRAADWREQTAVELTLPRSVELARSDIPDDDLDARLAALGEELVRRGRDRGRSGAS